MILIYSKIKVDFFLFSLYLRAVELLLYRCLSIEEWKRISERQHNSFIQRFTAGNPKKRGCFVSESHSVCCLVQRHSPLSP